MSDARVDRYYYIFDSREHRALVLDRATGEEQRPETDPRTSLIDHVRAERSPALQRRFARWCARQVDPGAAPSHTAAGRLWAAARRDDPAAWERVRRETSDSAMLAVALGLPQGRSEAARLLTLQACTHADAEQAALDAAHMSERWAEFSAESNPAAAARAMRTGHVNWLLDQLPIP
ncbi:MAG: hypothetical protein BRD30_11345 [Bacteroidetes bacterium QH_2_63_10]|nr:MAG: hypothetical protein BRD30_11345 [Bacteroidetes bacterium QH_2_63_10]